MAGYHDLLLKLGHKPWFAALGRRMVPLDRALQHATKGRVFILGPGKALPTLLLTAVGRKTGEPRTVPLLYARVGDDWIVTASNWGQPKHPVWSANVLAKPEVSIEVAGELIPVTARLVEGAERDELWSIVTQAWPAYDTYETRSGRSIRVFRLTRR